MSKGLLLSFVSLWLSSNSLLLLSAFGKCSLKILVGMHVLHMSFILFMCFGIKLASTIASMCLNLHALTYHSLVRLLKKHKQIRSILLGVWSSTAHLWYTRLPTNMLFIDQKTFTDSKYSSWTNPILYKIFTNFGYMLYAYIWVGVEFSWEWALCPHTEWMPVFHLLLGFEYATINLWCAS